ncbi:MAG: hypothetical protein NT032_08465 [Actinobacteria bacterium]|nr:hypothetical protein [Actinomycetota bacterium]
MDDMDDYLDALDSADFFGATGNKNMQAYYLGAAEGAAPNKHLRYSARAEFGRAMDMPRYESHYRQRARFSSNSDDYYYSDDYEDSGGEKGFLFWLGAGFLVFCVYVFLFG